LIVAWNELPEPVRLTIRALVHSMGTGDEFPSDLSPPFLTGCYLG
jgi:hypothetical protein